MPKKVYRYDDKLVYINKLDVKYITGIDETGTGSLAGPICVCAFSAPKNWNMDGVTDSKKIDKTDHKTLSEALINLTEKDGENFSFSVKLVHTNNKEEYQEYGTNLHSALKFLYWKTALAAKQENSLIVLDGSIKFPEYPYSLGNSISLPQADALIPQVSAASIIAKSFRDEHMRMLGEVFPEYNWKKNSGYPTKEHFAALAKYGISKEHRIDYGPIKKIIEKL